MPRHCRLCSRIESCSGTTTGDDGIRTGPAPRRHLVISDAHHASVSLGSIPSVLRPGGQPGRLSTYRHLAGDYLRAALPLGLQVRRCEEPRLPASPPRSTASVEVGPWELWPWCLADLVPEAARAVNAGRPATIIWHFQLTEQPEAPPCPAPVLAGCRASTATSRKSAAGYRSDQGVRVDTEEVTGSIQYHHHS